MDETQVKEIIKLILLRVSETGECKVGTAAREIVYYDISPSMKEEIANKISRVPNFISTKLGNDWVISQNTNYKEPVLVVGDAKKLSQITAIVGLVLSVGISFATWTFVKSNPREIEQQKQGYKQLLNDTSIKLSGAKELMDSVQKLNKDPLKGN